MTYSLVGHLARRGIEEVHSHYATRQQYIDQLEHDAALYENSGLGEIQPKEFFPVLITVVVGLFMIWSVSNIDTPSSTATTSAANKQSRRSTTLSAK